MDKTSLRLLALYNQAEELALLMHEAAVKNDWTEVLGYEVEGASIVHSISRILDTEEEIGDAILLICYSTAMRIVEIEHEVARLRDCYRNSPDLSSTPGNSPTLH